MSISSRRERFSRLVQHIWRTWLPIAAAMLIAVDAGYHLLNVRSDPGPGARGQLATEEQAETTPPSSGVMLTPAQRAAAGIVVEPVVLKPHAEVFPAPGEVLVNDYATSNVSSRLRAVVISRQTQLGDRVRDGQPLVRLYSAEMAQAESDFVLATKTYERMNRLKAYVSGQQFDESEVKRDAARSQLETYGLNEHEIADLASTGFVARPAGQFDLTAPQGGVITTDAFRTGEVIEPGKTLFEISNLATVWIEAQVSPETAPKIVESRARVTAGGKTYSAKIIQTLEHLNETTRTVAYRLEVANPAGELRPGEYANIEMFGKLVPELFVPTEAVLRSPDGTWVVYTQNEKGAFEAVPVQPLHAAGDETAITGIPSGTKVVTRGAFFIKSEAEKSGFGDHD